MKYIEELSVGECFLYKNTVYILTTDFKNNGDKRCVNLSDGSNKWLSSQEIVNTTQIYTLDNNNNIIPVKPTAKEYV